MRKKYFFVILVFLASAPSLVHADEFGGRFYGKTPAGMQDFTAVDRTQDIAKDDDLAGELQKIAPASGEEVRTQESTSNETSAQNQ